MNLRQAVGNLTLLAVTATLWLVVAGCWAYTFREYFRARAARDWPTTTGKVTFSAYRQSISLRDAFYGGNEWVHEIAYRYSVDDQKYRSNRLRFGGSSTFSLGCPTVETGLEDGRRVEVRYDPDHPSRSVILTDFSVWGTLPTTLLSVSFTLASLATAPIRRLLFGLFRRIFSRPEHS